MIREHITVFVYLASTVLLAACLALVTTQKCHVIWCIYYCKGRFW